jgi:hypothetical protein
MHVPSRAYGGHTGARILPESRFFPETQDIKIQKNFVRPLDREEKRGNNKTATGFGKLEVGELAEEGILRLLGLAMEGLLRPVV